MTAKPQPVSKYDYLNRVPLDAFTKREAMAKFGANVRQPIEQRHKRDLNALVLKVYQYAVRQLPKAVQVEVKRMRDPALVGPTTTWLAENRMFNLQIEATAEDSKQVGGRKLVTYSHWIDNNLRRDIYFGVGSYLIKPEHPLYDEAIAFAATTQMLGDGMKTARDDLEAALKKHRYVGKFLTEFPFLVDYIPVHELVTTTGQAVVTQRDAEKFKDIMATLALAAKPMVAKKPMPTIKVKSRAAR